MANITTISKVLSTLKAATDITKCLRKADLSIAEAEGKLKVSELMGTLTEAKNELTSIYDLLAEKDARILELESTCK